jgi:predicted PurR-regulated permease PerM
VVNPPPPEPPLIAVRAPRWLNMTPSQRNRLILVGIAVLGLLWLLGQAGTGLVPFIFALVLAYLLTPLVDRLARVMPRAVAILLVYLVVIGILVLAGFLIIPGVIAQINDFVKNSPTYFDQAQGLARDLQQQYQQLNLPPEVQTTLENTVRNAAGNIGGALQAALVSTLSTVRSIFAFLAGFVVIPFFLFYVLKDKDRGKAWLTGLIPRTWQPDLRRMGSIANDILNDYIRGQLILGVVVGIATTAGLFLVGSPYWLVLGIIAGVTELIPVLGPIIGSIPGLAVAAFQPEGLPLVLKVLLVYIVVQQLENNLLVPKIQGDSVKLHPAIILLVLVIGGQVAGLIGLIVAVPVTAIIRDLYIYLYERSVREVSPTTAEDRVPSRQDEEARGTMATE